MKRSTTWNSLNLEENEDSSMQEHRKKVATCKPGREFSSETNFDNLLILDFQSPQLGENKHLVFTPLSLQNFVMAAQPE